MALVVSSSGIRGIYDKDLTSNIAVRYAYAFCTFLREKTKKSNPTIVIGTDTRPSGTKICDAVMGILDCNFVDVGIAPTPAIQFAVKYFDADGGIIITASHNEPYWNGFKFLSNTGAVLNYREMNSVANNVRTLKDFHKVQERKILEKNTEVIKEYTDFILNVAGRGNIEKIKNSRQKLVLDPNGGAGVIAKKLLESIDVRVFGINTTYGEFNRKIEPTEDSLIYLKNIIDENNADFAAGFDCDADRVEILLDNGQLLSGHYILALIADEMLSASENPRNQVVVVNDATSNIVKYVVEKFGAKLREVEVGEINVVEEMQKSNAIVGGEGSSSGVILPPSTCRDGILTLLMVLATIAHRQKSLREILNGFPKYYTLRKNIEFNIANHDKIKKLLREHYARQGFQVKESGGIKGSLKVMTGKTSFVWFRASKTEGNIFRVISDSGDKEEAEKLMDEAVKVFGKSK